MVFHNCPTVILRCLALVAALLFARAASAQVNNQQVPNQNYPGNQQYPQNQYGYGNPYGYGNQGGYGYGNQGGYGYQSGLNSGLGSGFGSGSSRFGSGSSRFGSGSSRFGSGSSRFGSRSSRDGSDSSTYGSDSSRSSRSSRSRSRRDSAYGTDAQSTRDQRNTESSRNSRRNSRDRRDGKNLPGQAQVLPGQSTRAMGKTSLSQRKGGLGGTKGSGGAQAIELPAVKFDPKNIQDALFLTPSFVNVSPGDQFITTVAYYNSARHQVKSIDLWLKYNPELIEPVWADIKKLEELTKEPIEAQLWRERGAIHIKTTFTNSPLGEQVEFVDLHWKALSPALGARIELAGPKGETVAVSDARGNLVGGDVAPNKQKVSADVNITPPEWDEPGLRTVAQVDNMMKPFPLDSDGRLRLAILSPTKTVATGEVGTADILLINPRGLAFDDLKLRIRFDPSAVSILDADQENSMADGLNIFDGDFRQKYPFDAHLANLVDLERGIIQYHVGSVMGPRVYPSGVFARIVYRMKRTAGKATFWFEAEDPFLRTRATDVTAAGRSLLGPDTSTMREALHGFQVAVLPMDLSPSTRPVPSLAMK